MLPTNNRKDRIVINIVGTPKKEAIICSFKLLRVLYTPIAFRNPTKPTYIPPNKQCRICKTIRRPPFTLYYANLQSKNKLFFQPKTLMYPSPPLLYPFLPFGEGYIKNFTFLRFFRLRKNVQYIFLITIIFPYNKHIWLKRRSILK